MPLLRRIIFWTILILGAGLVAWQLSRPPEIAAAEEIYRFNRARNEAIRAGNQVAYSRHTVDNAGRPVSGKKLAAWKIIPETAFAPPTAPALQVVFVHDQDVTLAESISRGNYLAPLLRQWTLLRHAELPVEFHTFSWRADFGLEEFASARLAAHSQAASLNDYLHAISRPNAPVVLVAHGLGAQLVLDTLRVRREHRNMPLIRAVVLVQPAVHRLDLSRGTYELIANEEPQIVRYEGKYFPALAATTLVLATCSATDGVLSQEFPEAPAGSDSARAAKRDAALGLPYQSATETEVFPENFHLLDLSPSHHLDMALPGHDSLYDTSGRRALWTLWQSVLRQL